MPAFLRQLLAPGVKAPRWLTVLMVLVLAGASWWYVASAVNHGNTVAARIDHVLSGECQSVYNGDKKTMEKAGRPVHAYDLNDQRVYMNYAMGMREDLFGTFVTRMRMPMFM